MAACRVRLWRGDSLSGAHPGALAAAPRFQRPSLAVRGCRHSSPFHLMQLTSEPDCHQYETPSIFALLPHSWTTCMPRLLPSSSSDRDRHKRFSRTRNWRSGRTYLGAWATAALNLYDAPPANYSGLPANIMPDVRSENDSSRGDLLYQFMQPLRSGIW